jgi:glycerophosphoryl diester phosphodiesterase
MPDVIAHRGASGLAPEHTVAAYDLALEHGADRLELDVRPLRDGTPVVVHDRTLDRTCGDPRAVGELVAEDLDGLDPATRPLPLADVLDRYADTTGLLIELKEPAPGDAERVLDLTGRDGVTVQSFDHGTLERLARTEPQVELLALHRRRAPAPWITWDLPRVAGWARGVTVNCRVVDAAFMRAARALGLDVAAYTVNDEAEARRLGALGVDALITDLPNVVRG